MSTFADRFRRDLRDAIVHAATTRAARTGTTPIEAGVAAGIPRGTMRRIVSGLRFDRPRFDGLVDCARMLGCDVRLVVSVPPGGDDDPYDAAAGPRVRIAPGCGIGPECVDSWSA